MDELNKYLLDHYESYITGRKDCNLLLWGVDENEEQTAKLCTLIVGIEFDPLNATKEQMAGLLNRRYVHDVHFKKMYKFGDEIASKGNVPYIVIGFPSMRNSYDNRWEESIAEYPVGQVLFYLHELPSKSNRVVTGIGLRNYIYSALGKEYSDAGTAKRKNRSIADYFQFWSRSFLSRHLVKVDIDGMFSGEDKGVIVEIKRSNIPPIPEWRPYRNDYPDFILLKSFADTLGMEFTILHHTGVNTCDDDTVISLFEVENILEGEEDGSISYRKEKLEMKLKGDDGLDVYLREYV